MNKLLLELLEKAKQANLIDSFFVSPKGSAVTLYKDDYVQPIIEAAVADANGKYVDECVKYRVDSSRKIPLQDNEVSALTWALLFLHDDLSILSAGSLVVIKTINPLVLATNNYLLDTNPSGNDSELIIFKKVYDGGDRETPPSEDLEPSDAFYNNYDGKTRALKQLKAYAITDWVNDAALSIAERDNEPLELEID